MKFKVGDNVVLNKESFWVRQQQQADNKDGSWCSLEGVLTVTSVSVPGNMKVGRKCLYLERTSFAVVENQDEI